MTTKTRPKYSINCFIYSIKRLLFFIKNVLYYHQNRYLLKRSTLKEANYEKDLDVDLKNLSTHEELENLINNGFNIGDFFSQSILKKRFSKGEILFSLFSNKQLVHTSWVVREEQLDFRPPLELDSKCEAYVHNNITDPDYEGKGYFTYALNKISEFLANEGIFTLKMSIEKTNLRALKEAEEAGFIIFGEGKFSRILNFRSCRESYFKKNYPNYIIYQKNKWDSLARNNEDNMLRAVISADDLNNYYFDKATKNVLEEVVKLKHDFKVLDYGCGVGRISLWMAPKVDTIVGLDISHKMIEIAKRSVSEKNIKNLEFNVTNGKLINVNDESFNLIVCCAVLKYITNEDDLSVMLREFSRILKRGGYVAIIDQIDQNGPKLLNEEDLSGYSILWPSEYYTSLLESFDLERVKECSFYHNFFKSKYVLFSSIVGVNKYQNFDRTIQKKFIDLDLLFDKWLFNKFKTKTGFRLLYFERTS